ncbi:MAG: DNA-processing protein DprA [Mycobacterium leprae]
MAVEGELIWLTLAKAPGVGRVRLAELMKACPDPQDAWRLSAQELLQVERMGWQGALALVEVRTNSALRRQAEREWAATQAAGLRILAIPDVDYPVRLLMTPDPPPYLFVDGPWQPDNRPTVAVVGTRKPTAYGLKVADRLGRELAEAGAVVISGMARGIDSAAHRATLAAGGTTVAVLGGGADVVYPPESGALYKAIRGTGAVMSEQPPGTAPRPEHFPERNRIISGLADGILVVEAGERSGTLITVARALEQGRDVFAVPGPITSPLSVGPNRLIREGAGLVTGAQDILTALGCAALGYGREQLGPQFAGWRPAERPLPDGLTATEQQILGWMGDTPHWPDDLAAGCGLPAAEVQSILTMLELHGLVRLLPGGEYVRRG